MHVDPAADVLAEYDRRAARAGRASGRATWPLASEPAVSRDGTHVVVAANLGSVADARAAFDAGADGAGLVRTEFLFLGRSSAPDVDEQEQEYAAIAAALGGRRTTVRTLDVGGDKPLPYLAVPPRGEPVPRAARHPARPRPPGPPPRPARRAVPGRPPGTRSSVMFPMVSTVRELLAAREILAEAAGPDGVPAGLRVGMMVEVPAAALKIESFLPHLDFVSIGTNDLTQYTLAAERGNAAVAVALRRRSTRACSS